MARLEALRAAVLERPDDPERWAVYGDALQEAGDPRGQLVALEARQSRDPDDANTHRAITRLRFALRHALLGELASQAAPWRVVWRFGFPAVVQTAVDRSSEQATRALGSLDLLGLEALTLMSNANFDAVMSWFSTRDWPRLEHLEMGPLNPGAGSLSVPNPDILSRTPRLRRLRLEGPAEVSDLVHPGIEQLTLALRSEQLPDLDLAGLPALETLCLHVRGGVDADALRRVVDGYPVQLKLYHDIPEGLDAVRVEPPSPDAVPLLTPPEQEAGQRFHRGSRFWSIRRRGSRLKVTKGKIGRPGLERTTFHGVPYDAARRYRALVSAGIDDGWREVYAPAFSGT